MAVREHGDQRDRDGSFHINHVARVAESVDRSAPYQRVAWLHDVLEDCEVEPAHLCRRLPQAEFDAVELLTRAEDEAYEDYIDRVVRASGDAGRLARAVKEADLLDNLGRCAAARDPMIGRYGRALATLWTRSPGLGVG